MDGAVNCIGCGRAFKSQRQLSTHASKCEKNKALTLDVVYLKRDKKRKSQERDLLRDMKKPRQQVEEAFAEDQLDYVDLNLEVSLCLIFIMYLCDYFISRI
jgi:hypothetical protein